MSAPTTVLPGTPSAAAPTARMRTLSTVAAVAVVHAALIALVMRASERAPLPYVIQSPVIRAQLLSPAPVPATPSAPQSSRPAPQPVAKKPAEPRVRPAHVTPAPARTAVPAAPAHPVQPAPSAVEPGSRESADTAAAPKTNDVPTRPAQAASAATGRETIAISAPKNVRHIDCNIVKPDYPALSRRRGEEGTADVKFVIGLTGAIENIELAKSSGYPRHASSCRPYVKNGARVRAAYTKPFTFVFGD